MPHLECNGKSPPKCSLSIINSKAKMSDIHFLDRTVLTQFSNSKMGQKWKETCSWYHSLNDSPNSSQYATTTPKMFNVNSMAMNCPLEVCSAVSVALETSHLEQVHSRKGRLRFTHQTGTTAFKIPVPIPLTARARRSSASAFRAMSGISHTQSSSCYSWPPSARKLQRLPTQHQQLWS